MSIDLYFKNSDHRIFNCFATGTNIPQSHTFQTYAKQLCEKYPSEFFNKWIQLYGLSWPTLYSIINNITNAICNKNTMETIKWITLLCNMMDQKRLCSPHQTNLLNALARRKLFKLLDYAHMLSYRSTNAIIHQTNNIEQLEKLKTMGYDKIKIERKQIDLTLSSSNTSDIINLFATSTSAQQMDLLTLLDKQTIQILISESHILPDRKSVV